MLIVKHIKLTKSIKSYYTSIVFVLSIVVIAILLFILNSYQTIKGSVENLQKNQTENLIRYHSITNELDKFVVQNHALIESNAGIVQIQRHQNQFANFYNYQLKEIELQLETIEQNEILDKLKAELINYQSINKEIIRHLINNKKETAVEILATRELASYLIIDDYIKELFKIKSTALTNHFSELYGKINRLKITAFSIIFIFLLLLILPLYQSIKYVYNNLQLLLTYFKQLSLGELPSEKLVETTDEFGQLNTYANKITSKLELIGKFVNKIEQGDYNYNFESDVSSDSISNSLVKLRDSLQTTLKNQELRKIEDQQRSWASDGLAKFSDILRQSSDQITVLADEIIKNLVYYLNANQGGLFIYNDTDEHDVHMQLLSAFAYDRKKFLTKKIPVGDGLIGMCALEKQTIYITEIPEDYIEIESGLGDSKPNALLIVPLKNENSILGVIEIASFNKLEKFELEFVEKLAESIASTIANVRINARTSDLLQESQKKSQELAKQEKELRKTMESIRTAQEDSLRREAEMSSILMAIDETLLKTELDTEGNVISANQKFLAALGYRKDEIIGKNIRKILNEENLESFTIIWQNIINGQSFSSTISQNNKFGDTIWLLVQYTPINDAHGNVVRVLFMANDITEQKITEEKNKKLLNESLEKAEVLMATQEKMGKNELEMSSILTAIDQTLMKAEYSSEGYLLSANSRHINTMGYDFEKTQGKNILTFIPDDEISEFKKLWQSVCEGNLHQITVKRKSKLSGQDIWLLNQYTPVKDASGKVVKILYMAIDITKQKNIEEQAKTQTEELTLKEEQMRKTVEELIEKQKMLELKIKDINKINDIENLNVENQANKNYNNWLNSFID